MSAAVTRSPPLQMARPAKPETIDDVLRNSDQIIGWSKEAQNAIGYFAVLYRRVTLAIRDAINDGTFAGLDRGAEFLVSATVRAVVTVPVARSRRRQA